MQSESKSAGGNRRRLAERGVALLECAKGVAVLLIGGGIAGALHHNHGLEDIAATLLFALHMSAGTGGAEKGVAGIKVPGRRYSVRDGIRRRATRLDRTQTESHRSGASSAARKCCSAPLGRKRHPERTVFSQTRHPAWRLFSGLPGGTALGF